MDYSLCINSSSLVIIFVCFSDMFNILAVLDQRADAAMVGQLRQYVIIDL